MSSMVNGAQVQHMTKNGGSDTSERKNMYHGSDYKAIAEVEVLLQESSLSKRCSQIL